MPFWIVETNSNGNVKLWPPKGQPPFYNYMRAKEYEDDHCYGNTEVVELPTKNRQTAVGMLKARRVDQLSSVQKGMRKFRHPKLVSI